MVAACGRRGSRSRAVTLTSAASERALRELWPVFTEEVLARIPAGGGRDPAEQWPIFTEEVFSRLLIGARTYGDKSFSRDPAELCGEMLQELDDVMGWGFVLWCSELLTDPSYRRELTGIVGQSFVLWQRVYRLREGV